MRMIAISTRANAVEDHRKEPLKRWTAGIGIIFKPCVIGRLREA